MFSRLFFIFIPLGFRSIVKQDLPHSTWILASPLIY